MGLEARRRRNLRESEKGRIKLFKLIARGIVEGAKADRSGLEALARKAVGNEHVMLVEQNMIISDGLFWQNRIDACSAQMTGANQRPFCPEKHLNLPAFDCKPVLTR